MRLTRRLRQVVRLVLAALCACATSRADTPKESGISSFRTDVWVKENTTLEVREEITVNSAWKYYRYGFVRGLPIGSEDRWDRKYVGEYKRDNGIRVKILEVSEDGSPVRYEQGQGWGYSQLRIGEKDAPLAAGEHRYVVRYRVDGALRLDTQRDTLYWNALGHERDVPVAEAILSVHLPAGVPESDIETEPRVGGRGVSNPRRAETLLERVAEAGTVTYRATHVGPRQSLSVAMSWPAGYLHAPKLGFLGADRWLIAAPGLLFLYYLVAWLRIGPEPKPRAVVTEYEPPEGLSAAAVRYVVTTGTDGRSFAAVIAELAARGCLRAEPQNEKYKLSRMMSDRATEARLAPEEKRILSMLFEDEPTIELAPAWDQRNTAQNSRYVFAIQQELSKRLDGLYFTKHAGIIALGVFATFLCALLFAARASGRDTSGALFFTVWALSAGLMIGLLFEMAFWPACKSALRPGGGWIKLLPGTAAIGAFLWVIVYMLEKLAEDVSLGFALMLTGLLLVNLVCGPRLKRRTILGRQTLDHIAGFRLFLEKVEKDRLDKLNSAGEPPELLDDHLSYAIALEVREAWGDHLAQTFMATTVMR